jgi:tetratricopeptide (TPR) repeat protein
MARTRVTKVDDARALGQRLKAARLERGLTLRELSFAGCSAPYISAIEHGRRVPSLQILTELAGRLGKTTEFLALGRTMSLESRVTDAELALHLGEFNDAEAQFRELLPSAEGALEMRCLGGLGIVASRRGQLEEAINHLESARELLPVAFLESSPLVEALGRAYATRSEYESAIELFSESRARAINRKDQPAALKATVLLANTYIDLGDTHRSAETLADAMREASSLRDPMLRATVLWSQARLHTIEGRHDLGAEFADRALEILRANEDDRAVGLAHQVLAYIELERGNPDRAFELLEAALPIVERAAESSERSVFHLDRARALIALGRLEEARTVVQRIAPALREGPGGDSGRYFVVLAEIYEQLDELDDALTMYDAAIEKLANHRSPHLVRAFKGKAQLLETMGRNAEALAALHLALDAQDSRASQRS